MYINKLGQDLTHALNCVYTTKQMVRLGKVKNLPHVIRCISFTQFKLSTILHHIFFLLSHIFFSFHQQLLIPPAV